MESLDAVDYNRDNIETSDGFPNLCIRIVHMLRPDGKKLLTTSLINGVSKPFLMDLDGRNTRDVSAEGSGFTASAATVT